jgi:hypothetical protein
MRQILGGTGPVMGGSGVAPEFGMRMTHLEATLIRIEAKLDQLIVDINALREAADGIDPARTDELDMVVLNIPHELVGSILAG